ncbi:hypothetical protein G9H64_06215 [Aquirufa nivalisilvae]|uniref:MAE_28990/MAE_18760 family HEPN-like nuclease n=1 Tax=Aquirufa nivalisilvae TaxID=2516557 RepID=UPI0022A970F5|nr:MAE_28990/MAE_18760 family HEPN-like nuclease [Aquirufa nivalisilvae]MCZ2480061.1 hypothetical protein [Aquirufa nivalisilvae]MCZ2482545.1 hypothetical protein [Aquirufa nivalisilvae]
MVVDNLWAEIEAEQSWRTDEIRFFQNQISNIPTEEKQAQFRRAIILILYAHFEGFSKFAFNLYVNTINTENVKCKDANFSLVAATLSDLFTELRNPDKKSEIFRRTLPDDSKLHRFSRDKDFVENSSLFEERIVNIPELFIDMESNLKPLVLRKNLFRLGFDHEAFNSFEGNISRLLNLRNGIAHGELRDGITEREYDEIRGMVFSIMNGIKSKIMDALVNRNFLRSAST